MHASPRRKILALVLPVVAALAGTSAPAQTAGEMPPQPVTVVTVHAQDVALSTTLPGRVAASAEAEVRPQVGGIITERLFEEGRSVKVGDPLFHIDRTTYEAALAKAEAAVAQARAQAGAAGREADRVTSLFNRSVVSQQALDEATAARDAADAAVQVAEAQLLTAKIELDRTTILAPLGGVIGLARTSKGELVTAGQANPLAVIRTIDPVYVDVTQSAAEIIRFRRQMIESDGKTPIDRRVTLRLADNTEFKQQGTLTAAEPYVNETTGVVTLRLAFANPERLLLPGMYVQAVVQQATAKGVVLAPQEAVSRDRRGQPIALVVNPDNVVEQRSLNILQDMGNMWIVNQGLQDGDRVIVEGLQKTAPGAKVAPEERKAAEPATGTGAGTGTDEGDGSASPATAPAN